MARENKTKFAVLGLLSWRGPLSGYQVKQVYEVSASFFWNVSYGQIYPTLKSLEEEGLVTSTVERDEGRPERRIYEISDKGREALHEWLLEPTAPLQLRVEALLKILHGFREPPEMTIGHVTRMKSQTEEADARREATVELLRPAWASAGLVQPEPYWLLAARFDELVNQAVAQWCDEALEVLEKLKVERGGVASDAE
jgi:DNA-binding PadR family transcriptional regulator